MSDCGGNGYPRVGLLNGISQQKNLNDTIGNENLRRSFSKPIITSTPLCSRDGRLLTPTKSLSLRRYSLADINLSPSSMKEKSKNTSLQMNHRGGFNTHYNPNISTYIDSKSPGYATRVVQYNEEQEKRMPLCQSRYDKPGVFPIVHLFKKQLPILKKRSSQVTVKMNSPELSKYNTPEQNRMLLETIIRSNKTTPPSNNEVNTRSVLDALKEISRKRIHSNEEDFIMKEDGKRRRMDCINGTSSKKRTKESLSVEDSPSTAKSNSSLMNELMASHTSMDEQEVRKPKKEKKSNEHESKSIKDLNKSKLVDVETQTMLPPIEVKEFEVEKTVTENGNLKKSKVESKIKKASPIKVFDEKPLETMRKNRLSILMGSLGEEKTKTDKTDSIAKSSSVDETEGKTTVEKPLVSILLSPNKTSQKSNKHVSFNIPNTSTETASSSSMQPFTSSSEDNQTLTKSSYDVTKTSTALITPIVSSTINELSPLNKTEMPNISKPSLDVTSSTSKASSQSNTVSENIFKSVLPNAPLFSIPNNSQPSLNPPLSTSVSFKSVPASSPSSSMTTEPSAVNKTSQEKVASVLSFTTSSESVVTTTNTFAFGNLSNQTTSNISFGNKSNVTPSLDPPKTSVETSNKSLPGFKFDLKQPNVVTSSSTPPKFSFGGQLSSLDTSQKSGTETKSFAGNPTFPIITTSNLITGKNNSISFPLVTSMSSTTLTNITNSFKTPSNSFMSGTNSSFVLSSSTPFVPKQNRFPTSAAPTTTTATFGITSNVFTPSTNAVTTNSTAVVTSTFSIPSDFKNKTPIFAFGVNSNNNNNNSSVSFTPNVTSASSSGMFSLNQKPTFGNTTTTTTSLFQSSNTPAQNTLTNFNPQQNLALGGSASAAFNKPVTTFSSSTTTFTPMFGATNTETSTNNSSSFGMTPTFNSNAMFNGNNSQVRSFGNVGPSKSIFGTGSAPLFGTVVTTTSSVFSNNVQSFATSSNFPTVTTATTGGFGTSSNVFGTTTTTSAPAFGSNTITNFGTNNFGLNQNSVLNNNPKSTPSFGNPSVFNTVTSAPEFNTTTGFNQTNNTLGSVFGTTTSFEKPLGGTNFEANPFGNANNTFGGGNFSTNPSTTQSEVFTFGSSNTTKPAVFSFGASEPPKPSFNFTAENNSNIFGMGNKGFGANAPPAFGSSPAPQFNLTPSAPGMFNIGTGSSTPSRSRTQIKAKRRT